jgi:hypothetical protein
MVMATAAAAGDIPAMELLRARGIRWDGTTTATAAGYNRYECLRWLVKQGCPLWKSVVPTNASVTHIVTHKEAMLYMRRDDGVNNRIVLYAARRRAPLPPHVQAEVEKRGVQAFTLALCFRKASELAQTCEKDDKDRALWAVMASLPINVVMHIADEALLWVHDSGTT